MRTLFRADKFFDHCERVRAEFRTPPPPEALRNVVGCRELADAIAKLKDDDSGQLSLGFKLTGSQRKTAYALRRNVDLMIAGNAQRTMKKIKLNEGKEHTCYVAEVPENLNCTGFLTLTVGDTGEDGKFQQVFDAAEASRRFNNIERRVLKELFEKAVVVSERHANGAIHFHIVGILRGRPDIRTGFDFEQVAERDYTSASPALRALWAHLREVLPRYGFGRAELMPIRKTGEAVAAYVAKYVEKNICNRLADDHRKKLVRYIGWQKQQLKPNEFSWGTARATAWRMKIRALANLVGITEKNQMAEVFGARWAYRFHDLMSRFDDRALPFFTWSYGERHRLRCEIMRLNERWCREAEESDERRRVRRLEWQDDFNEATEYAEKFFARFAHN